MSLIKKIGAFATVIVFVIGMIYGGLQIMFAIGDNITAYKKQLVNEAVGAGVANYVELIELEEEIITEDPEVTEIVCFFLVIRESDNQILTKLWDEKMEKCRKERLK